MPYSKLHKSWKRSTQLQKKNKISKIEKSGGFWSKLGGKIREVDYIKSKPMELVKNNAIN